MFNFIKRNTFFACLGIFSLACSLSVTAEQKKALSFAIIGDLPYGVKQDERDIDTENLVHQLNTDPSLEWVVHVGDIKTGSSACSDAFLMDRKTRLRNIDLPLVYTPGDNEWTDCHRIPAGGYEPLDRLAKIRELFFLDQRSQADRDALDIVQQSDVQAEHKTYIENYSWYRHGVQFLSMHIVGSLNGTKKYGALSAIKRTEHHDREVVAREKAALDWLDYGFKQAKKNNANAMFLITHANPGLERKTDKKTKPTFDFFNKALAKQVDKFAGPVVLAHGDSHYARIDSPKLAGRKHSGKFLRLESFGENNNAWIKVTIDPNTTNVFSFAFYDSVTPLKND